jgi:hypothetical protein
MEDEINKISKKLSAAKQHRENHTFTHSRKNTIAHPIPSFTPFDTPEETVRRAKPEFNNSKELSRKHKYLDDRTNYP